MRQVVEYEEQARDVLLRTAPEEVEDKTWRAYGLLKHARRLSFEETMNLLSGVRLGVGLNLLPGPGVYTLNKLLIYHPTRAPGGDGRPVDRRPRAADGARCVRARVCSKPNAAERRKVSWIAMNGYNFTDRVRKVLQMAREEAARLHHEYVGTEHILLGLIREGEGRRRSGPDQSQRRSRRDSAEDRGDGQEGKAAAAAGPDLPYTSRAKKVLELAMSEARELNHSYVGTEHLLLGLLREEKGIAAQVLTDAGVNLEQARAETLRLLGSEMPATPAGGGTGAAADAAQEREEIQDTRARPLLPRSHAARRRRAARSDDRARRRKSSASWRSCRAARRTIRC